MTPASRLALALSLAVCASAVVAVRSRPAEGPVRVHLAVSAPVVTAQPTPPAATHRAATRPPRRIRAEPPAVVEVTYRVEVRVPDGEDFAATLAATMADPRGWSRAGFVVREDPASPYVVVLAEGAETDALCRPYDVGGEFSCQNGGVVAINAKRWRAGVPHWPDGLDTYRQMLLNHEMGHLLGQRHRPCPGPGRIAPVMYQQSGGLGACRANVWPTEGEIARASLHDLKIAPAYGE